MHVAPFSQGKTAGDDVCPSHAEGLYDVYYVHKSRLLEQEELRLPVHRHRTQLMIPIPQLR